MKRASIGALLLVVALVAARPSQAAFVIGGENGWQFSTDGFLNVFGVYQTTEKRPAPGLIGGELQDPTVNPNEAQQQFRVRTGLLPVGIGFNIKAPTINGVDMAVRLGIYPQIQNNNGSRTDVSPNIDFREVNFTASGSFGQILAGRAINLYQAKNILTDMTLFGAGVVGPVNSGPTMGHIGYGYLYPNFDAQFRYTTPDMGGAKLAISVNEANQISNGEILGGPVAAKRNVPRIESELSYATTFTGGKFQTWISGLYQTATFEQTSAVRPGGHATSLGGAGGVELGLGGLDMLVSGYGGQGLGMLGIQDFGALDAVGKERKNWGFLTQATYMLTPVLKLGVNYGQSNAIATEHDTGNNIKTQQAAVGALTYNINKYTQIIAEYTWAQDKWHNGLHQNSNMVALGTFFYW
jgi:predicted porin